MDEQHLLSRRLLMEVLITEREGMIALNQQRLITGQSMAYDDVAFAKVQDAMQHLVNVLR